MKKNLFKSIIAGASAVVVGAALSFGLSGTAQAAACQWQYVSSGNFTTSTTPVFNSICGVPYGTGDEPNFVTVRQDTTGDPTSVSNNGDYVSNLTNACTDGTTFDVHTYIHNDAMSAYNNNGSGSAVAHDVELAMDAPLGQTANSFTFTSTITASNAPTASDSATINCNGQPVTLSLVPNTIKIYNQNYPGNNWQTFPGESESTLANSTPVKIGSPILGSGDYWGCWNYRTWVVYEVVVHVKPTPTPSTGVCKEAAIDVTNKQKRTVSVNVTGETNNAKIIGYRIDFGDNTVVNQQSATHTYANAGKYVITAYVEVQYANGSKEWKTASACQGNVPFTVTPPPTTPPTTLPSTGPVGLVSLFAGTSGLGAVSHWFYRRRKFVRG